MVVGFEEPYSQVAHVPDLTAILNVLPRKYLSDRDD